MDALSIATGVVTLIGAVSKTIQAVKIVYGGPAELQVLFNEVSDLTAILNDVAAILSQRVSASENIEGLDNIIVSLQKSKAILQILDQFIQHMLARDKNTKIDVPGGIYQMRKRTWLVARRKVITFRKQLSAMREEMIEVIHLGNL